MSGAGDPSEDELIPHWTSFFDNSEKILGKKKLSEEDDGKRRKKLRVDDQPHTLMAEARPKLRAGTQLVEIPEFLGDYVGDMLGYVELRAHAEGELEGELDMLVKGAKSSMMLVCYFLINSSIYFTASIHLVSCNSHCFSSFAGGIEEPHCHKQNDRAD